MLWKLLDGPLSERPNMYGVTTARDVHLAILGLQLAGAMTDTETTEFNGFADWVIGRYRGGHTAQWWGLIDANAMGQGADLTFAMLSEFRASTRGKLAAAE